MLEQRRGMCGMLAMALAAFASGATSATAQSCASGAPPLGGEVPSINGTWDGPWILHSIDGNCTPGSDVCLGFDPCLASSGGKGLPHAVLLPMGDRQGDVMFIDEGGGRIAFWESSNPGWLDGTLHCSPYKGPAFASHWGDPCNYAIFCASQTPQPDGRILFAGGGDTIPNPNPPPFIDVFVGAKGTAFFDPTDTTGTIDPWQPGPDMFARRYYPTVVTMTKAFDGLPFIIGGTLAATGGVREWERLVPLTISTSHSCPVLTTPVDWAQETILDPGDTTEFEYYPRVHQLSNGDFFVAGDTNASFTQLCASVGNGTGETWFVTPPARSSVTGDLRDGPLDLVQGVPRNRYYGSSVLLHQQAANGGLNRVLIFGGSDGCQSDDPSCCNGTVTVLSGVSELNYVAGGTSTLVEKAPLLCPRVFSNAVVLPTGDVFISRGSLTDDHNDNVAPLTATEPHAYAEVYSPSVSKAPGSGSSVYSAAVPDSFVNFCQVSGGTANRRPPRAYHHLALLLPDGRVLVAGGDPVPGDWEPGMPTSPQCGLYGASGYTLEVFNPPYFYKGFNVGLSQAPTSVLFRQHFDVEFELTGSIGAAYIDRVVIIRTGSVTHHQDYSQRYIELNFEITEQAYGGNPPGSVGTLRAQGPAPSLAPPGYYLLFIVGRNGNDRVPSAGTLVEVK